ncbi:MAG: 3-oxoacyl-[acyl-carrier-protein] reductase [Pseudomonadota bacterium]
MFSLAGKKALVTGATGGIGEAIARALKEQGASVVISGTRQEKLDELKAELGDGVHAMACNLSDGAAVDELPEKASEILGGLDILVSNAGLTRDNIFMRISDEAWDDVIKVNLTAYFRLCRQAMRLMMRARRGRIIGITSVVGVTGSAGQGNYAASKAGMIGMSKSLAQEVASRGVTVNCIAPGFIATKMTDVLNDKQKEAILGRIPANRMGTPDEIASAVCYLASDEAAYITGQTLHVNGGMAMI